MIWFLHEVAAVRPQEERGCVLILRYELGFTNSVIIKHFG